MRSVDSVSLSVLMPNFNHADYLEDALDAVLAQRPQPAEIIVCDDGSTDGSVEILERIAAQNPTVRVICRKENRGVVYTMNELVDLATSDFVLIAACDDIVLPGYFARSVALLLAHPDAGLCSALVLAMDGDGSNVRWFPSPVVASEPAYIRPAQARALLGDIGGWIIGNTTVFRRDCLVEAGKFLPELRSFTDGFVELFIAGRHGACFVPAPLAVWRLLESRYSATALADPGVQRQLIDTATQLMRSPAYREGFPLRFVRRWRREVALGRRLERVRAGRPSPLILHGWRALLVLRYRPIHVLRRRRMTKHRMTPAVRWSIDEAIRDFSSPPG